MEYFAVGDRFEELDDEDDLILEEEEDPGTGVLFKTLRNAGILIAVCGAMAYMIGQAGEDDTAAKAVPSGQGVGSSAVKPAAYVASPPVQGEGAASEMVLRANANGHFIVTAEVNGTPIRFVVDTGATDIMISADDAERAGFRPHQLNFTKKYQSANGIVRGAPVRLRSLRVGQIEMYDVEASVNEVDIGISLLGMGFLSRLEGYQVENGKLVMAW